MSKYPEINWQAADLPEEYDLFKQQMDLFFLDNGITDKEKQAIKIRRAVGAEGLRRIGKSSLTSKDQKDPQKIWQLFDKQIKVRVNFRVHRLEFMHYRQKHGETTEEFVGRCREKAKDCDFDQTELAERIVELTIASTPCADFRKDLLEKDKGFTIEQLLVEGRKYEARDIGGKRLNQMTNQTSTPIEGIELGDCSNCGLHHPPRKCPAYNDKCKKCKKIGHWARKCRSQRNKERQKTPNSSGANHRGRSLTRGRSRRRGRSRSNKPRRGHQRMEEIYDSDPDTGDGNAAEEPPIEFYGITVPRSISVDTVDNDEEKEIHVSVDIICPEKEGQHKLKLKVDSGASGNTLPLRTVKAMYGKRWKAVIKKTRQHLKAYNNTVIRTLGYIDIVCRYGTNSTWSTERFYVVDVEDRPAIMGYPTSQRLKVLTVNIIDEMTSPPHLQSMDDLVQMFPECFDKIGNFKESAKIHLKDDAKPHIDPPRKCSVHIKPKLKAELQTMEDLGVIKPITKHTDWCSSITTVLKKDGSLRVCLDPKRLNEAVKRCPHKIPTLEELNPEFANAKYFSKLDAKAGYWSVHLDTESQELTTFRTPFGRYCFRRLPFGLSISQDIFQQRMDTILERAPGCVGIADDVAVYGATIEEHDSNLLNLMKIAKEEGLVFNSKKCVFQSDKIEFFGSLYTSEGIKPDPAKVEDINKMPTPQDKDDLRKFLGMISYLGAFIPNLSDKAQPLRDLLKQDVPYQWDDDHQDAFLELKRLVTTRTCLKYYDPSKPTVVEVDASQKGLGACLLQDNEPVLFASKSLTESQKNYSNIERETLAMVFGIRRLHTYLFGQAFTLMTDHKPLEMIWKKPLASAPPRLQRLLVKLLGYDFDVQYKPGNTMILADVLSRLPNPKNHSEEPLDLGVDAIDFAEGLEAEGDVNIDLVNFGSNKQQEIQSETSKDPILRQVGQTINEGWPDSIKELPTDIRPYWAFRDELGISNSAIFKGRQVVIPEILRHDILTQLHQGHLGIERTQRLARESVYWPNINKDIENVVKKCMTCQENLPSQTKEPLDPHDIPSTPWYKIATDLFTLDREDYLLIVDYHSKFPIVSKLHNTSSQTVAKATSAVFSMFGPPSTIISDNGPQYSGTPYQEMCNKWGIKHDTSSPRFPRSNGLAERNVRTIKNLIKKCKDTQQDIQIAMQHLRATPLDGKLPSPAEILFGRPVRTTLPSYQQQGQLQQQTDISNRLQERADHMKRDHDKHAGATLPPLYIGQKVLVQDTDSKKWEPGTITMVCKEPRSYEVSTPNGSVRRRNRIHLRELSAAVQHKQPDTMKWYKPKKVTFADQEGLPKNNTNDDTREEPKETQRKEEETTKDTEIRTKQPTTTRSGRICRKPLRYRDDQ